MRVDLESLTPTERSTAVQIAAAVSARVPLDRAQAIFRALASGEPLVSPRSLQQALTLGPSSLLRSERLIAASVQLSLYLLVGDESAERVISYLGQRKAVIETFIVAGIFGEVREEAKQQQAVR